MRLPDEQEERGMGMPVIYTIVAVSAFILIVLAVVFMSNTRQRGSETAKNKRLEATPSPTPEEEIEFVEGETDIETLYRQHKLRAEDLDFWDMYPDDSVSIERPSQSPEDDSALESEKSPQKTEAPERYTSPGPSVSPNQSPFAYASPGKSPDVSASPTPTHEPTEEEMAASDDYVQVTLRDGTNEWVEISEDIPRYTYDFTNIRISDGKMAYYQDGEKISWLGVDLSKSSGSVDFEALKNAGVDFVMLRLGGRGYETGLVSLDENFVNNITKAQSAGLEVGVTFFSQAVTPREAEEEAEFVLNNLIPYRISFPVAFDMEYIVNDESRIDILTKEDKTEIAETFLSRIELEGYRCVLYGNKNWLLGEIESEDLLAYYDVWLNEASSIPEFPYQFKMWKYGASQKIEGVENDAAYTISFVNYSRK